MSFDITGAIGLVLFVLAALVPFLVLIGVFVVLGRPWELTGLPWRDRLRIVNAVNGYDTWLSVRGVRGARRRNLRAELRANLWDAARRVGAVRALAAVGPVRALARNAVPSPAGPNWLRGLVAGLAAAEVVIVLQVIASTIWLDAAEASGASRVEGGLGVFPGMRMVWTAAPAGGGAGVSLETGPSAPVIAVAVFLLVSRPWRLGRRGRIEGAASGGLPDGLENGND
jgi:hypothetical protein